MNDKGKGNQKPWCDRDDDGARECKNDDADEAGLAAGAFSARKKREKNTEAHISAIKRT